MANGVFCWCEITCKFGGGGICVVLKFFDNSLRNLDSFYLGFSLEW